ncbi:MAG TPA: 2-oxoglutarate dehydrogenase complex dihydrolipoyllysine-residue succinyltransferase [Gemmatimonadaceae bacterium]|nr:2-oxoglutarate dehydrogenase complex dihydrolipoyllysine-residue succinyltransferase [Gemmatimonadaceae bacterium]
MLSITVPPLGESITEATVSRWLKKEGDTVAAGETLVELETDKITVEVPALKAGVLAARTKSEGDVVGVDDVLGQLDDAAVGAAAPLAPAASASASTAGGLVQSAPAARRLATGSGIDINAIRGTGRAGVISKPDVLAAIAGARGAQAPPPAEPPRPRAPQAAPPAPAPVAAAAAPSPMDTPPSQPSASRPSPGQPRETSDRETHERMSTRRRRIAENLLQAQHATAHLTTFNEIDMSAIVSLRDRMKEKVEKEFGVKLSFMPFFAKAAALALKAYPVVNAQIVGDSIVYKHYVNLGIAVASEGGLVVPIVPDADRMGIISLSREIGAIAKRAREGKLTLDDLSGGTFTITNGGVFGSLLSTPIINYPQSAILGLHKMQDRPVAIEGRVEVRPMMYVALSYDHRIIDGQQAVLFLVRVKEFMEDPASMLID